MDAVAAEIEDYPLHGVSLAAYAAVCAARDEGFALPRVLKIERVEDHAFARAEPKWEKRLQASPELLQRYRGLRAAAEDRLARAVPPLDEDISAWVGFLIACASATDVEGFLGQHGVGPNDLSRLSRLWRGRMAADPSLRDRIAALPARLEVPKVQAVAPVLRRSQRGASVDDRPDPAGAFFDFARYASLSAELEVFPDEALRIYAKLGLGSAAAADQLTAQFRAALAADARGVDEYRRVRAAALAHARSLAQPSTGEDPSLERPTRPSFLASPALRAAAPSFVLEETPPVAPPAPPAPSAPPPPRAPSTPPAAAEAGRTLDVSALLAAPLPFSAPTSPASVARRIEEVEALQRAAPPVPVHDAGKPPVPPATGVAPPRTPLPAGGTIDVSSILASPVLPFSSAPGAPPAPPAPPAPEPPRANPPSSLPPAPAPAAQQLTLMQYASLTEDLASQPARRAETLLRYRLTEADLAALDAAHRARFAADPAARAAFDQATATYRAWLSANRRG